AYRTDDNKPYVLPVVKKCELEIVSDQSLDHEYLPMAGNPEFTKLSTELLLGSGNKALKENRVVAVQTVSGTNGCRLAAELMAQYLKRRTIYLPKPTWENHSKIFLQAGFRQIESYPYWDPKKMSVDIGKILSTLCNAVEGSVVLFHCSAHNPTGMDPTKKEWRQLSALLKTNKLFPFFDSAYQGFASGDPDRDAWPVRHFINEGFETIIAQSFSKNMGLYNERVGNLVLVLKDKELAPALLANLTMLIRKNYSNPPAFGSRIVAKVLGNDQNRKEWLKTMREMAERMTQMRKQLVEKLEVLQTPGKWDHILKQCGMFCYTGLSEDQVEKLKKEKHIYMLKSGRINLCGLNSRNIHYVAEAISEVVKDTESKNAKQQEAA
ncbi:hypothetical protein KR222_008431, partial [Zaprionus bogoriensis]